MVDVMRAMSNFKGKLSLFTLSIYIYIISVISSPLGWEKCYIKSVRKEKWRELVGASMFWNECTKRHWRYMSSHIDRYGLSAAYPFTKKKTPPHKLKRPNTYIYMRNECHILCHFFSYMYDNTMSRKCPENMENMEMGNIFFVSFDKNHILAKLLTRSIDITTTPSHRTIVLIISKSLEYQTAPTFYTHFTPTPFYYLGIINHFIMQTFYENLNEWKKSETIEHLRPTYFMFCIVVFKEQTIKEVFDKINDIV